jgi:signal transduction histidine kinase
MYAFGTLYYLFSVARMNLKPRGLLAAWTLLAALLAGLGYISDTIRLLADPLAYRYFLPYLNRYVTPPVLFSGLVYLVTEYRLLFLEKVKSQAASDTMAHLAHDLRSPVLALNTIASAVSDSHPDLAEIAKHAVARIREMSNLMIAKSRPSAVTPSTPVPIVESAIKEKLTELVGYDLEIRLVNRASVSNLAIFERGELLRILSNLLNNAVEASQGACRVVVTIEPVGPGRLRRSSWLEISVADNGPGIDKDAIQLLGKPWATLGKANGNGLGLYGAKRSVESWGGRVSLFSERSTGTTVVIRLASP